MEVNGGLNIPVRGGGGGGPLGSQGDTPGGGGLK